MKKLLLSKLEGLKLLSLLEDGMIRQAASIAGLPIILMQGEGSMNTWWISF